MTNAPERIWIEDEFGDGDEDQWTYGTWDVRNYMGYDVEYVRADRIEQLQAQNLRLSGMCYDLTAERDRLRGALTRLLEPYGDDPCYYDHHGYCQAHFIEADCCVAYARAALKGESHE